jgi:curved DNA-binding protein CbpA
MTPKTEPDPYSVLGVARTASDSEIRAAYHALVAKYHPDRHQGNPLEDLASEKVAAINRAYEILSDPARRADYDSGLQPRATGQPYSTAPGSLSRKHIRWLQIVAVLSCRSRFASDRSLCACSSGWSVPRSKSRHFFAGLPSLEDSSSY